MDILKSWHFQYCGVSIATEASPTAFQGLFVGTWTLTHGVWLQLLSTTPLCLQNQYQVVTPTMSSSAGLRCSLAPGQELGQLLCADPKGMPVSRTHRKFCPTAADLLSIMAFLQPQPDHHTQIISQQFLKSPIPDNVLALPETVRISS